MRTLFSLSFLFLCCLSALAQTRTVRELYDEYRQNRNQFQEKYRNQNLTLTGKVRSISPASTYWKDQDMHRIYMTATGYENFVVCEIPYKDSAILNRFKANDFITVTGTTRSTIGDLVYLSSCTFANAQPPAPLITAPENAPLGKYNVYQNDGTGFNYQYTFYLKSYSSYVLNGKPGSCVYDKRTKAIMFSSGPLKGFAGLYRKTTDNEKDPPSFLLNARGTVPIEKSSHHGYQFGYYQG